MAKILTAYSEEEYFNKLDNMIHSSCAILRLNFKSRWQQVMGGEWTNDKKHRDTLLKTFDNPIKIELKRSGSDKRIKDGCLDDWDMTILSVIIKNFGDAAIYSEQNNAIKRLKDLRNSIAHHATKKIPRSEYDDTVETFRKCLRSLNVENGEIEKIITRADVTSSIIAMEKLKALYDKADDYLTSGENEKAIECYDEATLMPSLLPTQLGRTFEKRAEVHIQNCSKNKDSVEQALLDISQALKLNESSWNAYFLAGQCHRKLGDLGKAVQNLQRALSISPIQKKVRDELNACMLLNGIKNRGDHLTPNQRPMNFQERLEHLQNETGLDMTDEHFIKVNTFAGKYIKGQNHVFKGHQYKCGWGVEQDDIEACRYYLQAAKSGNAEGIYNLGLCYRDGIGITQDIDKAMEYFFQAANLSPDLKGEQTQRQKNVGVAAAQHMLGLSYAYGIGVISDFKEAAKWYKKAMDNGLGNSANNLGILYSQGLGVVQDRKMAFMCWKEGLNLMDANAPLSLICYYFEEMEPENVLATFKTCKEMGLSHYRQVSDEEFQLSITKLQLKRNKHESDVLAFEKKNNLKTKGLTFRDRLDRMHSEVNGFVANIQREEATKLKNSFDILSTSLLSDLNVLQLIERKAEEGSITAEKVHRLIQHCRQLTELLQKEYPFYRKEDTESIIDLIYSCSTLPFDQLVLEHENLLKVKIIIKHLFEKKCGNRDENDKRIRLCYVIFNSKNPEDSFRARLLEEGIHRYSENQFYYLHLTKLHNAKEDYTSALKYANMGLEIIPGNIDLLFEKAYSCKNYKEIRYSLDDAKKPLEIFLKKAEKDDWRVPEAYFSLAYLYLNVALTSSENFMKLIESNYKLGINAEKHRLPCFVKNTNKEKEILEMFFDKQVSDNNTKTMLQTEKKSVIEVKPYLRSPTRISIVQQHRNNIVETEALKGPNVMKTTAPPKLVQILPERASHLKPIYLEEMNPTSDHIYYNRLLDLTIIEDPLLGFSSIHLLAEDEKGDVVRLYVYNVEQNVKVKETLGFGCKVAIMNPYMRLSTNVTNGIRNDEPRCLIYLGKIENMCRFCGEPTARYQCVKCKKANYCSKECQELDWQQLNHKVICSFLKKSTKRR